MDALTANLTLDFFHNDDASTTYPYFLTTAFVVLLLSVVSVRTWSSTRKVSVPIYDGRRDGEGPDVSKKRWMTDSINLLQEGYKKYQDKAFQVWTTEGFQVVIPPKFIEETKMLQDHTFPSAVPEILQIKHTGFLAIDKKGNILPNILKREMNKTIPKLFPGMLEELEVGLEAKCPPCDDWTSIHIYPLIVNLVCRISGKAFVGPNLNRNEDWIKLSVQYTIDVFQGAKSIRTWSTWTRSIVKRFDPQIRRIQATHKRAMDFIGPIIKERTTAETTEGYQKPNDAIEWVRDEMPARKDDVYFASVMALGLGAASIHTTSQMVTNVIFDLTAHPEYIEILREEATAALSQNEYTWSLETMNKMPKMDSFVKESQRTTAAATSFNRRAVKDMTLSDGTFLPKGTLVMTAALAVTSDSNVAAGFDKFDGLRYYNMRRQSPEEEKKHQFTSTSKNMVHFGTGRHACPGRYFASAEIKLIAAELILRYDMKFRYGESRPKSILSQAVHMPDPMAHILFKKRDDQVRRK